MELRYAKLIIKDTDLPTKFHVSSKVENCVKTVIPELPNLDLELKVNSFSHTDFSFEIKFYFACRESCFKRILRDMKI